MDNKPSKYYVMIGIFFTSLSSILIRLSNAPSLVISAYRMIFTFLLLVIPVIIRNKKELFNIKGKELLLCIISGIFLAFHFASWIASINMTSIASSTVLVSSNPIFVAVGSYFILKEKLSKKAFISILIAITGSAIIALSDSHSNTGHALLGDLLAFSGAVFIAGYIIIGRIVRKNLSNGTYIFIVYLTSAIVLFALCFATNTPVYPYSIKEFLIFLALAFFCSILGHTVYNWLLQYLPATFISTSTLVEPIFASIMALVFFAEIPSILTLIGGSIVLLGIYLFIKFNK